MTLDRHFARPGAVELAVAFFQRTPGT